jgi:hypothetical protein
MPPSGMRFPRDPTRPAAASPSSTTRTKMGSETRITSGRDSSTYRCPASPTRTTSSVPLRVPSSLRAVQVWYRAVSDIGAVKAEETDAEPGPFRGDDRDGVPVADPLHLGDEGCEGCRRGQKPQGG